MIELDARGLRCPWPVLRLARAMREADNRGVAIVADDPAAPGEIAALAAERGWSVERNDRDENPCFLVRKARAA